MLGYALKEALSAIKRTKLTSMAATLTLTICLFLLGLFLMAYVNVKEVATKVRGRVQIEAFLNDHVDQKEAHALADSVRSLSAVSAVSYVNKEMALELFREQFGDEALQVLEANPLPASLKIELRERNRTFSQVKTIAQQIEALPGVLDVEYGRQWLSKLDRLLSGVMATTFFLGLILACSSVLVVATTIRLAFHVRKEAVEIMTLVGATAGFVARPFILEGAIYGFLGAVLGSILLALLHGLLSQRLVELLFLPPGLLVGLLVFGALLGGLGSALSLRGAGR
jgi:cell division transport system permease protein